MNHMISYEAAVLLQDAGFSEELVEALVKFQKSVNGQIATSSELQSVKSELQTDLRVSLSELKNELLRLESRLTLRMGAVAAFLLAALAAMKYMA